MKSHTIEIRLTKTGPGGRPYAEILAPENASLDHLVRAQKTLFTDGLKALGLKACEGCKSGLDFDIRQQFEEVIRI